MFKIEVINSCSFKIGDTRGFTEYIRNGIVRNVKVPSEINFKTLNEILDSNEN